jgi:glycosyltransferase involved in cell wall biosynthesis
MIKKRIAVLAVRNLSGEVGGAEQFCEGLTFALCQSGYDADLIQVISDETCFETIKESYLRFYDLDLHLYDGVLSTKAPAYMVRHANHITYLTHTMRVFYDMFETEFPNPTQAILEQRKLIHNLDTLALSFPRIKKVIVIGEEVRNRLLLFNRIYSQVITPPPFNKYQFTSAPHQDYIFMPGRLHRWKRVDLIIKAMKYVNVPIKLKIAGVGEDEQYLRNLAKEDKRIIFLGRVSDEELVNLYANALAVSFVPIKEDLGLVTQEAFLSGKPVITCIDSGGPSNIVQHNKSGFICQPKSHLIATKIDYLYKNPAIAIEMGLNGKRSIKNITWENVSIKLTEALDFVK